MGHPHTHYGTIDAMSLLPIEMGLSMDWEPLGQHHENTCSPVHCGLSVVQNGQTKHTRENCKCDMIGPDLDKIKSAIDSGAIPLVRIPSTIESTAINDIEVLSHDGGVSYLAISHVWSDGKGNKNANALPRCQLAALYDYCELSDDSPIWMDTLCIPYESEENEKYRSKAIASMNNIYLRAAKVVVIANDLLSLVYGPYSFHVWLQFRTSSWMRRFWTLQEGAFAGDRLYVRFANVLVHVAEAMAYWPPFRITSPVFGFTWSMTKILVNIREHAKGKKSGKLIGQILHELKWRDTAYLTDQPVVFAGLLGLDPTPLLEIKWWEVDCVARRTQRLFERIDEFPTAILYCNVKRLSAPGLGWAPQSLKIPGWNDDYPAAGLDSFLSHTLGTVRPTGLEMFAHLILVKPQEIGEHIPQVFHVHLEPPQAPDDAAQGLESKPVKLAVEQLPLGQISMQMEVTDNDSSAVRNPISQGPILLQNIAKSTKKMLKEEPYLAIVLKGFDRRLALEEGFATEGAITAAAPTEADENVPTLAATARRKICMSSNGSSLVRPTHRDPNPDQVKLGLSTKALGKRPRSTFSVPTKALQIDHAYGLMDEEAQIKLALERSRQDVQDKWPSDQTFSEDVPLLSHSDLASSSKLRQRRGTGHGFLEGAQTTQHDIPGKRPEGLQIRTGRKDMSESIADLAEPIHESQQLEESDVGDCEITRDW
ncbi:hypothetical protein G7Y79_00014g037050 [Physcia stellaris]|nr:hypothetical protein G7Y79_00014g037050 [Physcia stellaris]